MIYQSLEEAPDIIHLKSSAFCCRSGSMVKINFKGWRHRHSIQWELRSVLADFFADREVDFEVNRIVNEQMSGVKSMLGP